MIWNKMFYNYSVEEWLDGDPGQPPPRRSASMDVIGTGGTSTAPM
jgi:hypothetical protein